MAWVRLVLGSAAVLALVAVPPAGARMAGYDYGGTNCHNAVATLSVGSAAVRAEVPQRLDITARRRGGRRCF